jgi:hypothetical protein
MIARPATPTGRRDGLRESGLGVASMRCEDAHPQVLRFLYLMIAVLAKRTRGKDGQSGRSIGVAGNAVWVALKLIELPQLLCPPTNSMVYHRVD